jgi:periplasmic protein TonB
VNLLNLFKTFSTLQLALGFSVLIHAGLLTVRFVDPESFNRIFEDTALEVILVNAKSDEAPTKAQAIAQANLVGGGEADKGIASSPLPYSALTAMGNDFEEAQRKMDAMQEQQTQLLSDLRKELATLPPPTPNTANQGTGTTSEEEKRRQLVELLAQIEKRINEENSRPKKRYISPSTREATYAIYYDALRRRLEDKGTQNFPTLNGRKLYGELIIIITVNHDGRVLDTEIVQGSGNSALNVRAQAIAMASGPFGHFTPEMRAKADQIAMVARFKFNRDQTMETSVR